jgi:hypothetical protein
LRESPQWLLHQLTGQGKLENPSPKIVL